MRRVPAALSAAVLAAAFLVFSACGQAEETTTTAAPTTTTSSTTSTTVPPTTTTEYTGPVSILNGLPVTDQAATERRIIAVKIDNHWDARPQSGLEYADAVIELRVEGGLTRFMALFQTADTDYLGPVRSGRPSDAKVIRSLEATFFTSGAQAWVRQGIKEVGVPMFIDVRPGMFRISSRFAPHNLYADTALLHEFAEDQGIPDEPPPAGLWELGDMSAEAKRATKVTVSFSNDFAATWTWRGQRWLRTINGDEVSETIDREGVTSQIWADTLVMLVGKFYTASPPAGSSGSSVPATETIGTGRAIVFSGGELVEGTFSRTAATEPFELKTSTGQTMLVPPGKVWISIVPDVGSVDWK